MINYLSDKNCGNDPGCDALAQMFIPRQRWAAPYAAKEALSHGTAFECLYNAGYAQPAVCSKLGQSAVGSTLYDQLCSACFLCVDLNIYLDTHPDDEQALSKFNAAAQNFMTLLEQFEKESGATLNFGHSIGQPGWDWIEAPWPWQRMGGSK